MTKKVITPADTLQKIKHFSTEKNREAAIVPMVRLRLLLVLWHHFISEKYVTIKNYPLFPL